MAQKLSVTLIRHILLYASLRATLNSLGKAMLDAQNRPFRVTLDAKDEQETDINSSKKTVKMQICSLLEYVFIATFEVC